MRPLLLTFLFFTGLAHAEVGPLSFEEFKSLAEELAPKVNLFADVWAKEGAAQFYGGTTRDYLNWLKRRFRGVESREAADLIVHRLRERKVISVKEFITGESDVDVVSRSVIGLSAEQYGVKKNRPYRARSIRSGHAGGPRRKIAGLHSTRKNSVGTKRFCRGDFGGRIAGDIRRSADARDADGRSVRAHRVRETKSEPSNSFGDALHAHSRGGTLQQIRRGLSSDGGAARYRSRFGGGVAPRDRFGRAIGRARRISPAAALSFVVRSDDG